MKENSNHTFVICAYKEVPYLEECVKSLLNQTIKSEIIISTSTPNDSIKKLAEKYNIRLAINNEPKGHIDDFCFAYGKAKTKYVTLCHQDDVYYEKFAEETIKKMEKAKKPIIAFTNYNELRNEKTIKNNKLLFVKRLINFPIRLFKKSKKIRLFTLSLGNAICAPTVTYNKEIVDKPIIESDFKADIDWYTWIELAKKEGKFIYINKQLLGRRIHEQSLTTNVIKNNIKSEEDYKIFCEFWPKPIAKKLVKIYETSEKSNNVNLKKERKVNKMQILMVAIYLFFTLAGLTLYKYGANQNFVFAITNKSFELKISLISILGLVFYLCSFIIYMIILPKFDLSYIMPITSAISYIGIFLLSIFLLKETVHTNGIIGAIIILVGIIIMNLGGK